MAIAAGFFAQMWRVRSLWEGAIEKLTSISSVLSKHHVCHLFCSCALGVTTNLLKTPPHRAFVGQD